MKHHETASLSLRKPSLYTGPKNPPEAGAWEAKYQSKAVIASLRTAILPALHRRFSGAPCVPRVTGQQK
jgi:hypothetical protein